MARRKKNAGIRMNIPPCKNCPEGTSMRIVPGRDRTSIECANCGQELKSWEPPVIWVNGEPVPVRFGR
jgi:hypothetical protein